MRLLDDLKQIQARQDADPQYLAEYQRQRVGQQQSLGAALQGQLQQVPDRLKWKRASADIKAAAMVQSEGRAIRVMVDVWEYVWAYYRCSDTASQPTWNQLGRVQELLHLFGPE